MNKLSLLLILAALCMGFVSCKNSESEEITAESGNATKEITLSLNEEQVSMSTSSSPMTRAASVVGKKFYGINVYKKSGTRYSKYAYGFFDDTSAMSLILEEGKTYKFECVEIINDHDTLYHEGENYSQPFRIGKELTPLANAFVYSSSANLDQLTQGSACVQDTFYTWFPRTYTLYGTVDDFDPSTSNSVSIDMRRAVFGLHLVITPPEEGTATLNYLNNRNITIAAGDQAYDDESVYSFHNYEKSTVDGYSGQIPLKLTWLHSNGRTEKDTLYVDVARNEMTRVEIEFSSPASFSLNEEPAVTMPVDTVRWKVGDQ